MEGGVTEGEHAPVGRSQPVAFAARRGGHRDHRLVEGDRSGGAVEGGVTEGEHASVGGHEPVARTRRCRRHRNDRLVEGDVAGGAVEGGVAEGEDAPVGCDHPVALPGRRGSHADDRLVELYPTHGAEEAGVAEGEYAAVGCHLPVAAVVGRRGRGDDRGYQLTEAGSDDPERPDWSDLGGGGRAEEGALAEGEHTAVLGHQAVAVRIDRARRRLRRCSCSAAEHLDRAGVVRIVVVDGEGRRRSRVGEITFLDDGGDDRHRPLGTGGGVTLPGTGHRAVGADGRRGARTTRRRSRRVERRARGQVVGDRHVACDARSLVGHGDLVGDGVTHLDFGRAGGLDDRQIGREGLVGAHVDCCGPVAVGVDDAIVALEVLVEARGDECVAAGVERRAVIGLVHVVAAH